MGDIVIAGAKSPSSAFAGPRVIESTVCASRYLKAFNAQSFFAKPRVCGGLHLRFQDVNCANSGNVVAMLLR
jgi:hypothetical protein